MAKMSIKIQGLNEYAKRLENINGDINRAIESTLIGTHALITRNLKKALKKGVPLKSGGISKPIDMNKSSGTGNMEKSFMDIPDVHWYGDKAMIRVGFEQSISQHATYMMITGTAYTAPSQELYDAIYGAKTKREIKKLQKEILEKVITRS